MWTKNFQMFKLDLEKAEDQIANICWIIEKAKELQKKICFIGYSKVWLCGSQQTVGNS